MARYRLVLAYDGTSYFGWQVQKGKPTIQPLVQKALETVLRHPVALSGAGRTDAKVHAVGQVAHFDSLLAIDPLSLRLSLNALLPVDIRILLVEAVEESFHARYSATGKIYRYYVSTGPFQHPQHRLYRYHVPEPLDYPYLEQAARSLLGTHDFTSFATHSYRGSASKGAIRTLRRLDIVQEAHTLSFELEANGFLYKMVRNIVGTLLDVGAKRIDPSSMEAILQGKNRSLAGQTAPAHGLFLQEVLY